MSRFNEKEVAVARVYSRSMLDLAQAEQQAESLLEELRDLLRLMDEQPAFRNLLTSPLVEVRERERLLDNTLRGRASELLVSSLHVLNQHGRLALLPTIYAVYRSEYQERHGQVDVHVASPVPLTDAVRQQIKAAAATLTGRQGNLLERVDASLIGGLVVRIGDRKFDASVATQLRKMRQKLDERAAHEIHISRRAAAE